MATILTIFFAAILTPSVLTQTGTIEGQVIGTDGFPLPGLVVSLDRLGIRQRFQVTSDSKGRYGHAGLPPGRYEVSIAKDGETLKRGARVLSGSASRVDFDLRRLIRRDPEGRYRVSVEELMTPRRAVQEFQRAFDAKDDVQRAKKHLERAIEIAPHYEPALNNLGTIYFREQEFHKAEGLFERALQFRPDSFTARVNLGGVLIALKKFDRALTENLRALSEQQNDGLANFQTGLSFFYLKRYKEAVPYLQKARQSKPNSREAGLYLAKAYDVMGVVNAAIAEFEAFLKEHPRHPATATIESRLRVLKRQ